MDTARLNNTVVTVCYCAVVCIAVLSSAMPAFAERASLVIDADSGAVLYAKNARLQSFPASLTKLMTVYLIFEAMESKQLTLADQLHVSAAAARMPNVRLGLKQGQTITLQEVMLAMIVRSANDAAVVAAERMAGSEPAFANLMNAKTKTLGMSDTVFRNASGLPHPGQITSARDMAILARALMTDYPQYYSSFSARTFQYLGKTFNSNNNFTNSVSDIQGLKTGFTCHAGYNLVASVEKNGRRLIGVILGERNLRRRDARMSKILKQAFTLENIDNKIFTINDLAIEVSQGTRQGPNKKAIADVCVIGSKAAAFARASGWGLVLGVRKNPKEALALSRQTMRQYSKTLRTGRPQAIPFLRGVLVNRACITDLKQESATAACRQLRKRDQYCIVINPKVVRRYVAKGHMALERAQVSSDFSQIGKPSPMTQFR
jgi:D-alanyl-D-alanine carboxypeptidase